MRLLTVDRGLVSRGIYLRGNTLSDRNRIKTGEPTSVLEIRPNKNSLPVPQNDHVMRGSQWQIGQTSLIGLRTGLWLGGEWYFGQRALLVNMPQLLIRGTQTFGLHSSFSFCFAFIDKTRLILGSSICAQRFSRSEKKGSLWAISLQLIIAQLLIVN